MRLAGGGSAFRPELLRSIEHVDLLADLEWREIELLAGYMQAYEADPGCIVFREGEAGSYMGFLVRGRIKIRKETEDVHETVIWIEGQGRSIGEMALIDGEPRSATCEVTEQATLLLLTRHNFTRLAAEWPRVALKLLLRITKLISRRLRLTSGRLIDHLADQP
jgi:CRP-like cAMP-binding protein